MITENLDIIAESAFAREEENYQFRQFLDNQNSKLVDEKVHSLNQKISPQIDCTRCGNCCRGLMINLEETDSLRLAAHLSLTVEKFEDEFIEKSTGGMRIINTIPCHFLSGSKCNVYEARPDECRSFPGLHLEHFITRSFASLAHYGRCPIIYNVVEELKQELGFIKPK
ncbi:MAG: hypothetical protein JWN76_1388 [Chitinophagaceae bacterium]|nr:hypothetical protein [Chitinophagaceae bacterium]